jgi:hypothetical protein
MATISKYEQKQIEQANATGLTPVVYTALSFVKRFV